MAILLGLLAFSVALFVLARFVGWYTGWWKGEDAAEIAIRATEIAADIVSNGLH